MVKALAAAFLLAWPGGLMGDAGAGLGVPRPVSPSAAAALSPTAAAGPGFEPNHPVEDFFTVTLVSVPFTGLWVLLGASVVGGISQHKYPPEFDDNMIIGAGAVALGASVSIGLVSVFWGKGSASAPLRRDVSGSAALRRDVSGLAPLRNVTFPSSQH